MQSTQNIRILFCFLLLITAAPVLISSTSDSLKTVISKQKPGLTQAHTYFLLAKQYDEIENEKALYYGLVSYKLSKTFQDKELQASSASFIGNLYSSLGNNDSAIILLNEALAHYTTTKNTSKIASTTYNLGRIYGSNGESQKAIESFMSALKLDESLNDSTGMCYDYNMIGTTFYRLEKYDEALKYYNLALAISKLTKQDGLTASYLNNIGLVYTSSNKNNAHKALKYYLEALKIHEERGDLHNVAQSYNSIGTYYAEQKNFKKALEYFQMQYEMMQKIGDEFQLCISLINLGSVNLDMKNYNSGEKYLYEALSISIKNNYLTQKENIFKSLIRNYQYQGDYQNAFKYSQLLLKVRDSLFNSTSNEQVMELMTKYETQKKDKEILTQKINLEHQRAETANKKMQRNLFIGSFLFVLMVAFFIFRGYRNKSISEKRIIVQSKIIEEKQKEIIDSITYAKRIQNSQLPTEKYIDKTLKRLMK